MMIFINNDDYYSIISILLKNSLIVLLLTPYCCAYRGQPEDAMDPALRTISSRSKDELCPKILINDTLHQTCLSWKQNLF